MIILRNMQWRSIPIAAAGLALCGALDCAAIRWWPRSLVMVACASAAAYLTVGVVLVQYVLREGLRGRRGAAWGFHAEVFGLLALAALWLAALLRWVRIGGGGIGGDLASALAQAALFSLTFGVLALMRGKALYRRVRRLVADRTVLAAEEARTTEV
jgi:hypothetical protein